MPRKITTPSVNGLLSTLLSVLYPYEQERSQQVWRSGTPAIPIWKLSSRMKSLCFLGPKWTRTLAPPPWVAPTARPGESHILLGEGRITPLWCPKLLGRFPKLKGHSIALYVNFTNNMPTFTKRSLRMSQARQSAEAHVYKHHSWTKSAKPWRGVHVQTSHSWPEDTSHPISL